MSLRSLRSLRSRLSAEDGDSGIALIELVVAMSITLLMLTLIARMFAQVTHVTGDGQSTRAATGIAATAVDEVTRVVRQGGRVATSATSVEGAVLAGSTSTSLSIDSFVDATVGPSQPAIAPTRVIFSVDGANSLTEQRFAGTVANGYTSFSTSATSRTVNGPIVTTGAATPPLFAYSDKTGAPVVPSGTGLTSAQALSVTAVTVTVTVPNAVSYGNGSDPVQITNEVTMPNIAIVNGGY